MFSITVTHAKVLDVPDGVDDSVVRPTDWNAEHEVSIEFDGSDIPDGSISTSKLANSSVTEEKLSDGSVSTAKIDDDAVTNAKLANVATQTIKGRTTAGTGDPEDLTPAQARTVLNVADGANNYVHPNHTGDVTSTGDGATVIASDAVTNAKLANVATQTLKGRTTAGTGDPEDLTPAQARTLLNVADGANNYVHPNHTGDVTSTGDGATVIASDAVTNAKLANVATQTIKGRTTAGTGDPEDLTPAQARTVLNVADGANNYVHPNHTGDVTSTGDGATVIANDAVTNAKLANVATQTIKGRTTAGTGDPEDLTAAQATAILNAMVGDTGTGGTKGLVPAPAAGDAAAGKFLDAAGNWVVPAGGGGGLSAANNLSDVASVLDAQANLGLSISQPQGRLTLSTGVLLMTTTLAGQTTVFYTPSVGDKVPLYNGVYWKMVTFTELSQTTTDATKSPAAAAANSSYDMFVWDDTGTKRCTRGPAWASSSSRGTGAGTTELEMVNGILVNKYAITNGPAAQRGTYVGSIRTDASSQVNWVYAATSAGGTAGLFGLWNAYNRMPIGSQVADSTSSWVYASASVRQVRASAGNQISIMLGLSAHIVEARATLTASVSSGALGIETGVGVNSTTVNSARIKCGNIAIPSAALAQAYAEYQGYPGIGWNTFAWVETGGANMTNYGTGQGGQNGMSLRWEA